MQRQLAHLTEQFAAVLDQHHLSATSKEWYSTGDVAEAMGVSQYTVQERWCRQGRVECEKDLGTGKWRIPSSEYQRLVSGGSPRSAS